MLRHVVGSRDGRTDYGAAAIVVAAATSLFYRPLGGWAVPSVGVSFGLIAACAAFLSVRYVGTAPPVVFVSGLIL